MSAPPAQVVAFRDLEAADADHPLVATTHCAEPLQLEVIREATKRHFTAAHAELLKMVNALGLGAKATTEMELYVTRLLSGLRAAANEVGPGRLG